MGHILDNPAWNALLTGNRELSFGNDDIKYFDREVSPFAGFSENSGENFRRLSAMFPPGRTILFVSASQLEIPGMWKVLRTIQGVQMICEAPVAQKTATDQIPLTNEHVPQMLELTKLTNPGPFDARTIDFGYYDGIFEGDRLIAMAGQRLHAGNYTEVSAVCTRPGYTGKGYARQLIQSQISRMRAAGNIPYLHSRADNDGAIKLYQSLGFKTRIGVWFYFAVNQP